MCANTSAEAPEFHLHHNYIDRLWAMYQSRSAKNKYAYFPLSKKKMHGIDFYPGDLVDIDNQPGGIKICHQDSTSYRSKIVWPFLNSECLKWHFIDTL